LILASTEDKKMKRGCPEKSAKLLGCNGVPVSRVAPYEQRTSLPFGMRAAMPAVKWPFLYAEIILEEAESLQPSPGAGFD
jgi:hypothetical protein